MKLFLYALGSLFLFSFSTHSQARLLQILHTNDLHSYFEGPNGNVGGGYAKVLTRINELKKEAASKNIETLQMDAGDWGEGTSFFLSDNGADSIRALEMLGVEVATIGNHDHMVGGKKLGQQIRAANTKTKFVVANMVTTPEMELGDSVTPFVDVEKAGIPIRVIGLTTSEAWYQYSLSPGKVLYPAPIGEAQGLLAKKAGRELVIALTHIGTHEDQYLARNSSSIDVIVGGHSHSKLATVTNVINKKGKKVPIVQAWAHGLAVGSLLLDVDDKGVVKVIDYKLHEVGPEVIPDPTMVQFVEASKPKRDENMLYPGDEVIGESKTAMTGYQNGKPVIRSSCWGRHLATAARFAAGASVGIHVSHFEGVYKAAGPVTYKDLADSFPHFRNFGDQGWEIVTVTMSGLKLRAMMYFISRRGYGVTFSGLGYKAEPQISDKATYRIAIPAEVALAIKTSLPGYRHYLQNLKHSGKYYWPVMVDYIKKNTPLSCR